MPIYEYRCQDCNKKSSFFVRSVNSEVNAVCEHCQSERMSRTISRVAHHRSMADIHERSGGPPGLGDPGLDYYSDPRNIGRGVEESFERFGVDMPDSVRETIDSARDGQLPEGVDL